MIPSIPPSTTGSSKRRVGRRALKRRAYWASAVAGLLVVTSVVVVAAVTSTGGRSGTLADGLPAITELDPSEGLVNAEVRLVGSGFTGASDVEFNGVSVNSFNVVSDTEIVTLVPEGATTGAVTVQTPDGIIISGSTFRPLSPIVLTIQPTTARAGDTLTIKGQNLSAVTKVRIAGREMPVLTASDDTVRVVLGPNAVSGTVTVVNDETNGSSNDRLTVTSPAVTDISPNAGGPGTNVTITGANLQGAASVTFNGVAGTVVSSASDGTSVVVAAPPGVTPGPISITVAGGSATSDDSFVRAPVISEFSPNSAVPGKTIRIKGQFLSNTSAVVFTSSANQGNNFTVVSDTELSVTVPDDAATGPVTVIAGGNTTSTASFTVAGQITAIAPEVGPVGTVVTLYGSGFTGATAVSFNGKTSGTVKVLSDTKVTATVPTGATTGAIAINTPRGTLVSAETFTVGTVPSTTLTYDRAAPAARPVTAPPDAPIGGTDFSRAGTVKLFGLVLTNLTPQTTSTASTTTSTTTTTPTSSTTPSASTSAPGTTVAPVPQTPYSGTATVKVGNSTTFNAKVTYTDPLNWTVAPSATGQNITIGLGAKAIIVSNLAGSVTAANGVISWTLTGKSTATTLITSKFTFNAGALVTFTDTCPTMGSPKMCAQGAGPFARLDADAGSTGLAAVVGNVVPAQTGMAYQATIDLARGLVNVDATFPAGTLATIRDGRLRMAYKDDVYGATDTDVTLPSGAANGGWDIVVTGKSHVDVPYLGGFNPPSVTVWYLDGGSMLTMRLPTKRVIGEASMLTATFVTGKGSPVSANILGEPKQLTDNAWVFTGSMRLPSYIQRKFGTKDGEVAAIATMTSNGATEVKAQFRTPLELPDIPYVKTTFEGFSAGVRFNESAPGLSFEAFVGASGTIKFGSNAAVGVALEMAIAKLVDGGFEYSASLTGSGLEGRPVWPDMLGVKDFDLDRFSIQLSMYPEYPFIGVGLAGNGTLPSKLLEYLGASDGLPQPATFVVNLSASSPCLQVTVGTPDNDSPIISFPPGVGVLEVNYLSISASAVGCSVGIYDVPAGVVIAEKAKFLGVKRDYYLAFNPNPTGPAKLPSFYGWDISETDDSTGSIQFRYKLMWGAGGWNPAPYFSLNGYLKLGNNNGITVTGGCRALPTGPLCTAKGDGRIDLGKGLSATMSVNAEGIGTAFTSYTASGDINLFGLKFGLTGSFASAAGAPLGWDFSATADLPKRSALVDQLGVRVGYGIRKNPTCVVPIFGCKKWLTDPLFSLTISGNTGGLFKFINGAADAFGEPPVAKGGRYSLRKSWSPEWTSLSFAGSSSIGLGALGTITAGMNFYMCITTSCLGDVDATFAFDYKKAGKTWSFSDIPIGEDWGFDYSKTYSDSFSESGKTGDSWGGLKGTVSGNVSVTVKVDSSPLSASVSLSFDLQAKAYLGLGGDWNYLGTYGVSYDSGSDRFCFGAKGYKICV